MTQEPIEAVIARLRETRPHWSEAVQDDIYWASEIEADLSRLLDYVEGMRWRPIETAPKDVLIDIWIDNSDGSGGRWASCYYDQICDQWRTSRPGGHLVWVAAKAVTHWRPLPDAPAPETGDGRRKMNLTKEKPMTIDNLTIGEAKQLAAMFGGATSAAAAIKGDGRPVIVRSRDAGVQFGYLEEYSPIGATVTVRNARQMWSWTAAQGGTLLDCANHGVKAGKFSTVNDRVIVLNACAIIDCTPEAVKILESAKWA